MTKSYLQIVQGFFMRILNILVAEDDDQNQSMMKLILSRQGHNIKSAWNGNEAIAAVQFGDIDLVFMDVHMPEMDGLETTRQIRLWENNKKHVPIVILSGSVPNNITDEYKKAGADTFILKPFDVKKISLLVELIAGNTESNVASELNSTSEETIANLPILEVQDALPRFGDDYKFYIDNLSEYINSLPERLSKLDRGLSTRNWNDLNNVAHNLKGVSANYGAKKISYLAGQLEESSQQQKIKPSGKLLQEIHQANFALIKFGLDLIEKFNSSISGKGSS